MTPKFNDPETQQPQNLTTPKLNDPKIRRPWNNPEKKGGASSDFDDFFAERQLDLLVWYNIFADLPNACDFWIFMEIIFF